ncbi:hypothetical protein BN85409960 [Alteracholeplasma palmae J233]|uniref:Uncharacterized protein n=1 Tax=Alteracholeplasma palmae (strain ATCC 49389 / J233) TaxID=1318466 RepID=U4KLB1_ALTPJ|nr:hypothetical protein [Alteracholeplasma palmae]CCV64573.1 hypothetical protein BN85409960 [Alteracholeplasma palmae J233]
MNLNKLYKRSWNTITFEYIMVSFFILQFVFLILNKGTKNNDREFQIIIYHIFGFIYVLNTKLTTMTNKQSYLLLLPIEAEKRTKNQISFLLKYDIKNIIIYTLVPMNLFLRKENMIERIDLLILLFVVMLICSVIYHFYISVSKIDHIVTRFLVEEKEVSLLKYFIRFILTYVGYSLLLCVISFTHETKVIKPVILLSIMIPFYLILTVIRYKRVLANSHFQEKRLKSLSDRSDANVEI